MLTSSFFTNGIQAGQQIKPPKNVFCKKTDSLNHSGLITNTAGNVFLYLLAHCKVILYTVILQNCIFAMSQPMYQNTQSDTPDYMISDIQKSGLYVCGLNGCDW